MVNDSDSDDSKDVKCLKAPDVEEDLLLLAPDSTFSDESAWDKDQEHLQAQVVLEEVFTSDYNVTDEGKKCFFYKKI